MLQDRIMVALTTMLVLAAFFTQTSNTIPKTSYLKLVDVWYLVLICQVFAIIVSLVYVENLRLRFKLNKVHVTFQQTNMTIRLSSQKANRFCLFFYSLVTVAILVSFVCMGLTATAG